MQNICKTNKIIIEPYKAPIYAPCKIFVETDNNDKIVKTNVETGYQSKRFDESAKNISILKIPYILGQVDCKFSYSTSLASLKLIEKALNLKVSEYAQIVRTILVEIGRCVYFGRRISEILQLCNANLLASKIIRYVISLETLVLNSINQKSLLFYWMPSGVRTELHSKFADEFQILSKAMQNQLKEINDLIFKNIQFKDLLQNKGLITKDDAENLNLSGLSARSTGLSKDAREKSSCLAYSLLDFKPVTADKSDAFNRFRLMFCEINLSLGLIEQLISKLQDCEAMLIIDERIIGVQNIKDANNFDYIKALEFFRNPSEFLVSGEYTLDFEVEEGNLKFFMSIQDGQILNFEMKTPSQNNILAFEKSCVSHTIEELPLILSTFDISFSQADK